MYEILEAYGFLNEITITFVRATVKKAIRNLTWDRWGLRAEGAAVWETSGLKRQSGPQRNLSQILSHFLFTLFCFIAGFIHVSLLNQIN